MLSIFFMPAGTSWAAALQEGNLLISTSEQLYEYTPNGTLVQSYPIPYPGTDPSTESARDIVATPSGDVFVFNGTFRPFLSTLSTSTDTWQHQTHEGWSIVNNGSYGGIATLGDFVFVTDMLTDGNGVVRFDLANGTSLRFAENIEPIDLTIGLDGLLYVLHSGGSPGGRFIDVFDPLTMDFIHTISLADIFGHTEHRSIAVNANGDIFIADWDGEIQKIDAAGNVLNVRLLDHCYLACNLFDINVSRDGLVVIGDRFGGVTLTDEDFSSITFFQVGTSGIFASIVPAVPAPIFTFDVAGDSYLRQSSPFTNYGTDPFLLADRKDKDPDNTVVGEVISVLQWDVSAIPPEAIVQSANITLNLFDTSKKAYNIYAAQVPWSQDTVTWNDFSTQSAIGNEILGTIAPNINGENVIDLTPAGLNLIQGWIDGSISNNGIVIQSGGSNNGIGLDSSEAASGQPTITINY